MRWIDAVRTIQEVAKGDRDIESVESNGNERIIRVWNIRLGKPVAL